MASDLLRPTIDRPVANEPLRSMATGHAALRKRAERDALIQKAETELGVFADADENFVKAS